MLKWTLTMMSPEPIEKIDAYVINRHSIYITYNPTHVEANTMPPRHMTRMTPYAAILGRWSLHRPPALDHLAFFVYYFCPSDLKDFLALGAQLPYKQSQGGSADFFKVQPIDHLLSGTGTQSGWMRLFYSPKTHLTCEVPGGKLQRVYDF